MPSDIYIQDVHLLRTDAHKKLHCETNIFRWTLNNIHEIFFKESFLLQHIQRIYVNGPKNT